MGIREKKEEIKRGFRASLKSSDTEEWFDIVFYRPLGYMWALLAKRLGITPNAITIASIFIGIGAGVAFYYNDFWVNVLGVVLLMWADSFDSADGQLARMTKQYSRIGRLLDGMSSELWFVAIYVGICLRENHTSAFFSSHSWAIWVMAVLAGLCHGLQASMADYYRQFHLFFLKGESGSEFDSVSQLRGKVAELSWGKDFWNKLFMTIYANYTAGQERKAPRMRELREMLSRRYGGSIPQSFRDSFRRASLPLMKYTNILSFNTRSFALFASILIFRMPWLYFAFELTVLNIVLIYMMVRHERICRGFVKELKSEKN